jgi:hypothetical protein
MDSKTLIKALKVAVREVIKEELTEILREGLQSTITEMTQSKKVVKPQTRNTTITETRNVAPVKSKVKFTDNKWASVLNETEPLIEQNGAGNFMQMMNEGIDEIRMTSADANNFGVMRQNMKSAIGLSPEVPTVMEDPETGKIYDVAPEVQQALTRDYSALMNAINKKKSV